MKNLRIISLLSLFVLGIFNYGLTAENSISLSVSTEKGDVNKSVFGSNLLGQLKGVRGDYGYGVWDPKWSAPVGNAINLMKEAKITVLRFPGGLGASLYDWKLAIGKDRSDYLFGINEFLTVCNRVEAEPIFTVAYFTGDESDAADLVEYLNAPVGSNPNGGIDWAKKRSENGHPAPFNLKYFEIGNEVYDTSRYDVKPQEYANRYLKYYDAMKKVDSSIKIGVILAYWQANIWNKPILEIVKNKVDFGILHVYPTPVWGNRLSTMPAKEIFTVSLAQPITTSETIIQETLNLFKRYAGKSVPIAVTEFNGGFAQDNPVPYRHCMGNALVNAELLRVFMKPENNILLANNWNFCNEYWGMVANGFQVNPADLYNPYVKRPNYYVFEMYAKYFGDKLIAADVQCGSYLYDNKQIPYLSVNASKTKDGKKITLMVVNKNLTYPEDAVISLNNFEPYPDGNAWVLNGPSVDATNEVNPNNVTVSYSKIGIYSNTFRYTFAPHSVTAIEIFKAGGAASRKNPISKSLNSATTGASSAGRSASKPKSSKGGTSGGGGGGGSASKSGSVSQNTSEATSTESSYVIVENKPPIADDQFVPVEHGKSKDITLRARDHENNLLSYFIVKRPEHGRLSGSAPKVTYIPERDYTGNDTFTFQVNDHKSYSNIATVTIDVQPTPAPKEEKN